MILVAGLFRSTSSVNVFLCGSAAEVWEGASHKSWQCLTLHNPISPIMLPHPLSEGSLIDECFQEPSVT